jgi:hypothetical protein
LHAYLGVCRSQVDEMVKNGLLHPYNVSGGRSKVVDEAEVATLQEKGNTNPQIE